MRVLCGFDLGFYLGSMFKFIGGLCLGFMWVLCVFYVGFYFGLMRVQCGFYVGLMCFLLGPS